MNDQSEVHSMEVLGWALSLLCWILLAAFNPSIGYAFAWDQFWMGVCFFAFTGLIGTRIILGLLPAETTEPDEIPPQYMYPRPVRRRAASPPPPSTAGYVYLMKIETGLYKIGLSTNPASRLTGLSTGLPYDLRLIHSIKCHNRFKIEKFFQDKFAHKRVRGEWFNLDPEDIEYFTAFTEA